MPDICNKYWIFVKSFELIYVQESAELCATRQALSSFPPKLPVVATRTVPNCAPWRDVRQRCAAGRHLAGLTQPVCGKQSLNGKPGSAPARAQHRLFPAQGLMLCTRPVHALAELPRALAVLFADDSQLFAVPLHASAVRHDSWAAKFGW